MDTYIVLFSVTRRSHGRENMANLHLCNSTTNQYSVILWWGSPTEIQFHLSMLDVLSYSKLPWKWCKPPPSFFKALEGPSHQICMW